MDKRKQGIAGLRAPMARDVARLSQYSRGDDRNLAHVAPGDTIIPPELMRTNPALAQAIFEALADAGIDPAERVVDSGAANRNPMTGAQEFDWDGDGLFGGFSGVSDVIRVTGTQPGLLDPAGLGFSSTYDYFDPSLITGGIGSGQYLEDRYGMDVDMTDGQTVAEAAAAARRRGEIPPQEAAPDLYDSRGNYIGGATAADFIEGGGGYSFEDYYNDLLEQDRRT